MYIEKHIENEEPYTWLDWIESGIKKYEGRLNKGFWKDLNIGDRFVLFDSQNKKVFIEVTCLIYFKDFKNAFKVLKDRLVPIENITELQVEELYSQYFSEIDINTYGVVAIGIKPINLL